MIEIEKCTIADLEARPNFKDLVEEYAQESAIKGLPHPYGKIALYKQAEANGTLCAYSALEDSTLVGFLVVLTPVNLHYGIQVAVSESIFVTKEKRKTGAGTKLIREAEKCAQGVGSPGLLISAPLGSILAEVLDLSEGYEEVGRVFFRKFI